VLSNHSAGKLSQRTEVTFDQQPDPRGQRCGKQAAAGCPVAAAADFVPGDVGRSAWRGRISRSESLARPPILSYAQNGEDVVLSRAFADQEFGFYVDIGACHPVEDSVTLHFYERGWHGVNVEPDRELHALFLEARPRDTNLCAAVGRPRGRVAFHPTATRGHGTLDATLASTRCAGRPAERVPAMLLSDVIDCHGPDEGEIDFLKIDVEGWEAGVIASGDWTRHRPRMLLIGAVDDKPGHGVTKRPMPQRRLDPHDELPITTKVKTPEPNWSVTGPVQVGKLCWGPRRNPRSRNCERRGAAGGSTFPVRSSHRKRSACCPLPYATSDKDQVVWRLNAL
jgi:FkbM family methyltransferase